jgi:hypothetical protein
MQVLVTNVELFSITFFVLLYKNIADVFMSQYLVMHEGIYIPVKIYDMKITSTQS